MKRLVLPFNLVPDSAYRKLSRSLPPDYFVKRIPGDAQHPQKFLIQVIYNHVEKDVATVTVVDGEFVFELEDNAFSSNYFVGWMEGTYRTIKAEITSQ